MVRIVISLMLFIQVVDLTSQSQSKPNILFILADDLGINALQCYGNDYVESPAIDRLFQEGVHFINAYANAPTCAPSRACIMSGQSTPDNRIFRVVDRYKKQPKTLANMRYLPPENDRPFGKGVGINPELVLLPEALKLSGYKTAGFGKWHLGNKELSMIHQGFDVAVEAVKHYNFKTFPVMSDVLEGEYHADYITRKGIEFITRCKQQEKPFFLYLPYYLVHKPLEPKEHHYQHFKALFNELLDDETIKVLAMIKSLDESVGLLLEHLESLGVSDETIVVFSSDNGHYRTDSPIFTQPYRGFKGTVFEGGLRVPLIIRWPENIKAHKTIDLPVTLMDLYPTLLDLTSSTYPENYTLDGISFAHELTGKEVGKELHDLVWMYSNYSGYNPRKNTWRSKWFNVIQSAGWKLIEDVDDNNFELYNLENDPYEKMNLADKNRQKVIDLKTRLKLWKIENGYPFPKQNPAYREQN